MTISAKIIADSISQTGYRITTFELEYPRFIHSEFMTHRAFSRNAASSRAIPVKRAIELIKADTARPIHWGRNQPGMSADKECDELIKIHWGEDDTIDFTHDQWWDRARDAAIHHAKEFDRAGYHKQIVNRGLEPYSHIKVVLTATEYDNFFWLRNHKDAQPEIEELAKQMLAAFEESEPVSLGAGEWHTPYYLDGYWKPSGYVRLNALKQAIEEIEGKRDNNCTLTEAIAISASCCAQVSYRKNDPSLEKAEDIYKRLVDAEPVHASPFEHQATPIILTQDAEGDWSHRWEVGITHQDRYNQPWSGNFCGWIQNRQLIPNNVYTKDKRGWLSKPKSTSCLSS